MEGDVYEGGLLQRLVLRERGFFESAIITVVLVFGFTTIRHFIDNGRLGIQFVSCVPAVLIAAILLRPWFTILTAFGSIATVQWLLIGKRWFQPLDLQHVFVASLFVLSIAIVVVIGRALRESLHRSVALARQTQLLNSVLHDRMKSNIGMLHAIVTTAPSDASDESFRADLAERINGLATASEILKIDHDVLRRLPEGLERILAPFNRDGRIALSGPACQLDLQSAVTLTMVVNRLAAESARSGALSIAAGRLALTWAEAGDGDLGVGWEEQGPQVYSRSHDALEAMKALPGLADIRCTETEEGLRYDFVIARPTASTDIAA